MKNKKIIIRIPFSERGNDVEASELWNRARLKIFTNYTLKSLKAQTNQDFIVLIRCRDIMKDFILNEVKEMASIPDNVRFVFSNAEHFEQVNKFIIGYEYYYEVRLDSDDMYINTFIDMLHSYTPKPETEILISQNCYAYEIYQKRLASFFYPSPQSYIFIYKSKEYAEGKRYHLKKGHTTAILLKHELLLGNNYIDTVHNNNTSSIWEDLEGEKQFAYARIPREEIKDKEEIKNILKKFGIYGEEQS